MEPEQAKLGKEPHSAAEKENLLPDNTDESSTVGDQHALNDAGHHEQVEGGEQYSLMLAEIKKGNESLKILTGRVKKTEKRLKVIEDRLDGDTTGSSSSAKSTPSSKKDRLQMTKNLCWRISSTHSLLSQKYAAA